MSALPPLPKGWFCVGFAHELKPGDIWNRRVGGRDLVVFRTESGSLGALDAHCPHLGAHFGHGGKVLGESIQCPFHGFCFDASGACVKTGYGTKPPPRAVAGTWPVSDVHGIIMLWFDPAGQSQPEWTIPEADTAEWTTLRWRQFDLPTHPQEIAENSVDLGHLTWIHGYHNVEPLSDLVTDGPYLNARYGIHRPAGFFGKAGKGIRAQFEIHQYGLGYARVEVDAVDLGVKTRQLVLVTPTDEGRLEMRIAMQVRKLRSRRAVHPALFWMPRSLLTWVVATSGIREFRNDVQQDVPVWENKRYITPPALAKGDGPIGQYRKWAQQFYGAGIVKPVGRQAGEEVVPVG